MCVHDLTSLQHTSRTGPVCICWALGTVWPLSWTSQHRTWVKQYISKCISCKLKGFNNYKHVRQWHICKWHNWHKETQVTIYIYDRRNDCQWLTSLAHEPPTRKFPGIVGGLNAKQLMLSSGGDVTSTSYYYQRHLNLISIHI